MAASERVPQPTLTTATPPLAADPNTKRTSPPPAIGTSEQGHSGPNSPMSSSVDAGSSHHPGYKADAHYAEGIAAVKQHKYAHALQCFSRAAFLAPSEPLPIVGKAEAYSHLCDIPSAIGHLRKAISMTPTQDMKWHLQERLAQMLDAYGLTLFQAGNVKSALLRFEEAIEEKYMPVTQLHRCMCWVVLGEREKAVAELSKLTSSQPELEPHAYSTLVSLALESDDYPAAKQLVEEAIAEYPSHSLILDAEQNFDVMFTEYKANAVEGMNVDMLTRCIATFGEDSELYRLRAVAHVDKRQYTLAVQDLFACISKSGGSNPVAASLMASVLATIAFDLHELGDYVSAINYYTESLKWVLSPHVLMSRGDCSVALGRHEAALTDYKAVPEDDPLRPEVNTRLAHLHDTWGVTLYNEGKWKLAEAEFTRAIKLNDQDPMYHYHRAQSRFMLQDQVLAVRDLISCRDLKPTDPKIIGLVTQFCRVSEYPSQPVGAPGTSDDGRSAHSSHTAVTLSGPPPLENKQKRKPKLTPEEDVEMGFLRTERASLMQAKYTPTAIRSWCGTKPKPKPSAPTEAAPSEAPPPSEPSSSLAQKKASWKGSAPEKPFTRYARLVVSEPEPPRKSEANFVERERQRRMDEARQAEEAKRAPPTQLSVAPAAAMSRRQKPSMAHSPLLVRHRKREELERAKAEALRVATEARRVVDPAEEAVEGGLDGPGEGDVSPL